MAREKRGDTLESNESYQRVIAHLRSSECPQCRAQELLDEHAGERDLKKSAGYIACKRILLENHHCGAGKPERDTIVR